MPAPSTFWRETSNVLMTISIGKVERKAAVDKVFRDSFLKFDTYKWPF